MATKKKEAPEIVEVKEEKVVDERAEFINRKLKVINMMQNPAKARAAAARLLGKGNK